MPLTNDILLNGVAYTVIPGTYKRKADDPAGAPVAGGPSATARRRLILGPFTGGQRHAFTNTQHPEPSTHGWDSLGTAPVFDGAGVEPFPNGTVHGSDALLDTTQNNRRCHIVIVDNAVFMGNGRRVYKSVALDAASWANWTVFADCGSGFTISGLALYQGAILVLFSTGQDIRKLNTSTGALSVWRAGESGAHGVGYKG